MRRLIALTVVFLAVPVMAGACGVSQSSDFEQISGDDIQFDLDETTTTSTTTIPPTTVDATSFGVMLIPETWEKTSLSTKRPGSKVNLEADIVGKFVAKMIGQRGGLTEEQLRLAGFVK